MLTTNVERYRLRQRELTYVKLGEAELQTLVPITEGTRLTFFLCEQTGKLCARPVEEFTDGRFERLR